MQGSQLGKTIDDFSHLDACITPSGTKKAMEQEDTHFPQKRLRYMLCMLMSPDVKKPGSSYKYVAATAAREEINKRNKGSRG